jgi:hypothetical protein
MDTIIKKEKQSGQSLVEVMVAITVLTVGFLGISSLLSRSLALNRVTTDEITGTYLASEGVEIAKNLIDHDIHNPTGTGWGTCFTGRGQTDFEFDYTIVDCGDPSQLMPYISSAPLFLWYHADTHLYNYEKNGGTETSFTRFVRVVINGDEAVVNSRVAWSGLAGARGSVNLEDHFYKWY